MSAWRTAPRHPTSAVVMVGERTIVEHGRVMVEGVTLTRGGRHRVYRRVGDGRRAYWLRPCGKVHTLPLFPTAGKGRLRY